jgi:UDP-N-acetylmuramoyl-tripeptide--D-alanyl-D-alanine ligase
MTLWTNTDLENIFSQTLDLEAPITGISIDSRTIEKGDLFVCLKGPNFDAHDHIVEAYEKGAIAFIADDKSKVPNALKDKTILVKDGLNALTDLAHAARARTKAKIIGITGSVGKTSTKDMLSHCFRDQAKTFVTSGNFNNHIGLPLMLARMPIDTEVAILEMGMNHAGEIAHLSQIAKPHIALITTISEAHIEFFDSIDDIARAKGEIFEGMMRDAIAILNKDNAQYPILEKLAKEENLEIATFGAENESDTKLISAKSYQDYSEVEAEIDGTKLSYTLSMPGAHYIMNSFGVLLTVSKAGYDVKKAATEMANLSSSKRRGEIETLPFKNGEITLIDDSYNAIPQAVKSSIAHLKIFQNKRKIIILGEMLELGDYALDLHLSLKPVILASDIAKLYCCGVNMKQLYSALPKEIQGAHAANAELLWPALQKDLMPGDLLFIKGANSTKMNKIAENLREFSKIAYSQKKQMQPEKDSHAL